MTTLTMRATFGYLFTNRVHVFLMPIFPTAFWNVLLQLPLPPSYYLMIVSSTVAGYVYNIYTDFAEDALNYGPDYRIFHRDAPHTLPTIYFFYALSSLCALQAGWQFLAFNVAQQALGCLYSTRVRLGSRSFRIKEVPFLKNLYAAAFWSFALMLTPYVYAQQAIAPVAWVAVGACFGMAYFVELSWDLRDVPGDRASGVRTVPIVMGERFAYAWLVLVHAATCGLAFWATHAGLLPLSYGAVFAAHLIGGLVYLAWYARLKDKNLASHLFLLWLGVLFASGIAYEIGAH